MNEQMTNPTPSSSMAESEMTNIYKRESGQIAELRKLWEIGNDETGEAQDAFAKRNATLEDGTIDMDTYKELMNHLSQIRTDPDMVIAYNPGSNQYEWTDTSQLEPDEEYFKSTNQAAIALAKAYGMKNPDPMPMPARLLAGTVSPRTSDATGLYGYHSDDELMAKHPPSKGDVLADAGELAVTSAAFPMRIGGRVVSGAASAAIPVAVGRGAGMAYDQITGTDESKRTSPMELAFETGVSAIGGGLARGIMPNPAKAERQKMLYNAMKADGRNAVVLRAADGTPRVRPVIDSPNMIRVVDGPKLPGELKKPRQIPKDVLKAADGGVGKQEFIDQAFKGADGTMPVQFRKFGTILDDAGNPLARNSKTRITTGDVNRFMTNDIGRSTAATHSEYKQLLKDLMDRESRASQLFMPTRRPPYRQSGRMTMRQYADDVSRLTDDHPFEAELLRSRVTPVEGSNIPEFERMTKEFARRSAYRKALDAGQTVKYRQKLPIWNRSRRALPDSDKPKVLRTIFDAGRTGVGLAGKKASQTLPHSLDSEGMYDNVFRTEGDK